MKVGGGEGTGCWVEEWGGKEEGVWDEGGGLG